MRSIALGCILCLAALGQGFDIDGDGTADWFGAPLKDENSDGRFDRPGELLFPRTDWADSLRFIQVWTSGTILNNQWDADCGYLDDDPLLDILGHHWNPNQLHVFESDGSGGYEHVWVQTESIPPGSYVSVTHGDPDEDGDVEIIGGECSTLGKVILFENTGDDSWGEPHVLFRLRNERIRTVRVDDTNGNDTAEIIVFTGDVDGGKVHIFEHSGAPGEHTYTEIYTYETVSYVFQGSIGDSDNDGRPECLLGIGGWGGFPMYIRRIVFDPDSGYVHRMFQARDTGLHANPFSVDTDSSGEFEHIVGSCGRLYVFEYTGNNTFSTVWYADVGSTENLIAGCAGAFPEYDNPVIFACPFSGEVYAWTRDDTAFHQVTRFIPSGSPIRSIDACADYLGDGQENQILLAESGPADYASVWRDPPTAVKDQLSSPKSETHLPTVISGGGLRLQPTANRSQLTAALHDPSGRLVMRLQPGDNDVGHVAPGVYFVRQADSGPRSPARRVVVTD
jgi:hypothetical protein